MNDLENNVVKLNYQDLGSGDPIIFIHGWASDSNVWSPIQDELSKNFRLILIDLRGCGKSSFRGCEDFIESSVLDIANLIKKLNLKKFSILGWSLGGMVAMKLAATYKEDLDKVILISTTPKFVKDETFSYAIENASYLNMLRMLKRSPEKTLEYFRNILLSSNEKIPGNLEVLQNLSLKTNPQKIEVLISSLESLGRADIRPMLPCIKQKTLIIHGKFDEICLFNAGEYLNKSIKNSKLFVIDDAGHIPFLTKKNEVLSIISEFLEK